MKIKSITGNYWNPKYVDEDFVRQLKINLDIPDVTARILSNRVTSIEEGYDFIYPKIRNLLPDPFHLRDMDIAIKRTVDAITNKENICIFADYDVDGATSSALLKNVFREIGHKNVNIYVPDRIIEGYGPSELAMQKIYDTGAKLLITVDCGAVAFDALSYAANIGLDVIVIDHHMSLEQIPRAIAVINPNRLDEQSEYKNLAAVGVSFLFACGLITSLKKNDFFKNTNTQPPNLLNQLDIVALGTVCDVMLLTGLNRAFVVQGLLIAAKRKNIGYNALCDISSIDVELNCYHLGFVLGPRINAGGRVGTASFGATLLSTESEKEAYNIAKKLNDFNEERKAVELKILAEAESIALKQSDNAMLFISGNGWHPGLIGIIAGRLKEKYNKAVAVIAINNGHGKASCRSISGVDFGGMIIEAKNRNLLIAGGGHSMAAGFTVSENKLDDLKNFLNKNIENITLSSDKHLRMSYDLEMPIQSINNELIENIEKLAPFGNGNATPIIKISNVYILHAKIIGKTHIQVVLTHDKSSSFKSKSLKAIAFNAVNTAIEKFLLSKRNRLFSIFGSLKINHWNGIRSIQLQIKDIESL